MTFWFVLVAGSLATAAAVLLALPLLKKRVDEHPSASWAALAVLGTVLLGGAGFYALWSNFAWSTAPPTAETPAAQADRLARELARQPDNVSGWLELGGLYQSLEQYPLAVRAYQRADRLANNQNADAVMGLAESLVLQDPMQMEGAGGRLFERALELDPDSGKALFFSAFAAVGRGENALARERFARLLALGPPDNVKNILNAQIARLDAELAQPADEARISVRVDLAPALRAKLAPAAMLFVLARDPAQPGPPFAVKRLPLQFPVDVQLTAADAMLPSRRIAPGQKLEVVARVALSGTPTAASGDPFGQVGYHVGKDESVAIVIDRLTP